VRAFLEEYHVPLAVKTKAKEAYSYYLTKKSSFGESGIFDDLPQPLLFRLVLQLYEKDIKKVQLFCTYECSFVVTLVTNCKPFQATHGEVIFNQGDVSKEIVFVPAGMVRLSVATGSGHHILCGFVTEGGYFGDMEYFRNTVITMAQYSAVSNCEFLSVPYAVLSQAVSENLDSGTQFSQEVSKRYAAFVKVTKSAVLGDLQNRDSLRQTRYSAATPHNNNNGATGRTLFSTASVAAKLGANGRLGSEAPNGGANVAGGVSTRSTRLGSLRRSSTSGTHTHIWINGHIRDHRESAHYVRMALARHSSENLALPKRGSNEKLAELGSRGGLSPASSIANLNAGTAGAGAGAGGALENESTSTDSLLSMLQHTEVDDSTSCRVLMKDEDGSQLVADITHRQLHQLWLIDPSESWKVQWDVILALIIIYTLIMTPVDMAFYDKELVHGDGLELVLDGIFFCDLLLSFRTTYASEFEGALLLDQSQIAWRYLQSWFLVDFVSSVPFTVLFGDGLKSVKLIKALRLFRLMKLARIFKLEVLIGRLEDSLGLSRAVFELLQVLVEVFFVGHLVACLWWGVSDSISSAPWFTNPDMVYGDLRAASVGQKYLFSLYFTFTTMTTVGYGDIHAVNSGERMLNICIIVIGASVFGYIIANVSTILESFSRVEAAQSSRIMIIKEYLNEKNCPDSLQGKVVAHFKHLFSITSAYDVTKIMSRLPPSLRDEILYFHNEVKMKHIPIFRHIQNRSLALHIFNQLTPAFYEVDQYIQKQGRESGEINFLVIGTACAFRMDAVSTCVDGLCLIISRDVICEFNCLSHAQSLFCHEASLVLCW
jgi:CRP-like cAMP-binding protein